MNKTPTAHSGWVTELFFQWVEVVSRLRVGFYHEEAKSKIFIVFILFALFKNHPSVGQNLCFTFLKTCSFQVFCSCVKVKEWSGSACHCDVFVCSWSKGSRSAFYETIRLQTPRLKMFVHGFFPLDFSLSFVVLSGWCRFLIVQDKIKLKCLKHRKDVHLLRFKDVSLKDESFKLYGKVWFWVKGKK